MQSAAALLVLKRIYQVNINKNTYRSSTESEYIVQAGGGRSTHTCEINYAWSLVSFARASKEKEMKILGRKSIER